MKKLLALLLGLAMLLSVASAEVTDLPRNETVYMGGNQWGPISGYNPLSSNMNNYAVAGNPRGSREVMFESLYMYNMLDGGLYPLLADGDYVWNDDLTEMTVKIKAAAKWSDGTALTADDMVATWEAAKKLQNGTYNDYAPYIEAIEPPDGSELPERRVCGAGCLD